MENLLFDGVADKVLDELEIVGPVGIDPGFAVAAAMAEVGPGGNVAAVHGCQHGRVHGRDSSASSAAQSLRAAVPGALQTALAAICHAQRQGDRDIDVLVGVGAVKEMDEAVGGVAATRR